MIKDVGPSKKLFNKCVFPSLKSNGSSNSTFQNRTQKHFKEENQFQVIDRVIGHGSEKRSVEGPKWNQLKPNENGRIDCLTCLKSFANFPNAKQHFREQHLANKEITCELCGKVFNYKRNMMGHIRKYHQNNSLKNQLQDVLLGVDKKIINEKHEAIERDHGISTKNQATKSVVKLEKKI